MRFQFFNQHFMVHGVEKSTETSKINCYSLKDLEIPLESC